MEGDSRFQGFQFALGAETATMPMKKSSYVPASSLLEMGSIHKEAMPYTANVDAEITVDVKKLDDIATEIDLTPEILIKIDVQGFEANVITGGESTFRKARIVLIENSFFELYVGQELFDDIYARMKHLGFSYRGSMSHKLDPMTGEILFEDSIFIRT